VGAPNLHSWDAGLFREHPCGGYHIPRNWHLFMSDSLTILLTSAELDLLTVQCQSSQFSWLYSYHHRLRYGAPPHPRLAVRFDVRGGSLLAFAATTAFDNLCATLGAPTSNMLLIARKPGRHPGSHPC
jgi:hypothetical protein